MCGCRVRSIKFSGPVLIGVQGELAAVKGWFGTAKGGGWRPGMAVVDAALGTRSQ